MGILNIRPASMDGIRLLVQLYGESQSGKTESALKLARGLAGPKGRILLIDTEAGRARLSSNRIPGGFFTGDLRPPFSPERYIEAIKEGVDAGFDVIIIDSFSHAWEGQGGILEMADNGAGKNPNGKAKWAAPKKAYRRLINQIFQMDVHVILCSRGKLPLIDDPVNPQKQIYGHVIPVQDKSLRYDMTVVLPMLRRGEYSLNRDYAKWPPEVESVFSGGGPVNIEMGEKLAVLVGERADTPAETQKLAFEADEAAARGVEAYRAFWSRITQDERRALFRDHDDRKSRAEAADLEVKAEAELAAGEADETPTEEGAAA